jgi:hypothetical protein
MAMTERELRLRLADAEWALSRIKALGSDVYYGNNGPRTSTGPHVKIASDHFDNYGEVYKNCVRSSVQTRKRVTETKFTPGPWFAVDGHHTPWTDAIAIGTDPQALEAVAHTTRGFGVEMQWANARLIAAAPDLYYALKAFDERGYTQAVGDIIKSALAKVEHVSDKDRSDLKLRGDQLKQGVAKPAAEPKE